MPESKITTGSPELAKERKLIREITEFIMKSVMMPYKFRRIEEQFGGYRDGYYTEFILIESGKRDRLFQSLTISFATQGHDYYHRGSEHQLNRVVVRVTGTARISITKPRERRLERSIPWDGNGNEITFDRNRSTHVQANAIIRLLMIQQERFDEARSRVLVEAARWDRFATAVKRMREALKIRGHWGPARGSEYGVEHTIAGTKRRKALITMDVFGNIKIRIDDLTEQKLVKVVKAFR